MNTRIDIAVVGTLGDLRRLWVVYSLVDASTLGTIHVGLCRADRLFEAPDAEVPADLPVIMTVLETLPDRHAGYRRQLAHAKTFGVAKVMAGAGQVECVDTGQRWPSAFACANALGIDPGALSRHLRGQAGHNKIKGLKYRRIVVDNKN